MADTAIHVMLLAFLVGIFVAIYKDKTEAGRYCMLLAGIACVVTGAYFGIPFEAFLGQVQLKALIFLVCLSIVIGIIEQHAVFEYFAVKIIHVTKRNIRLLFYVFCIVAAFSSAFLEDLSVTMIFIPLIIKTAHMLRIDAVPFINGASFSIIIGNLLTSFSTSSNILISELLDVGTPWFFEKFFIYFVLLLSVVLVSIDLHVIRHMSPPEDIQVRLLIEILNAKVLIRDRRRFVLNTAILVFVFTGLIAFPVPSYMFAFFCMVGTCLVQGEAISKQLKRVNWQPMIIILSMLLLIACMVMSGLLDQITALFIGVVGENVLLAVVLIIVTSAVLSSFFARTGTIILFATIINQLVATNPVFAQHRELLVMALVIGAITSGNIVPQASSQMLQTISMAQEKQLLRITYKSFTKNCIMFISISLAIGFAYILAYSMLA